MRRKRREPGPFEPVGPLLQRLLRGLGLERRLAEYRAVEVWPEVVGPEIAAHARAVAVREGVLFVDVASSVWMQELSLLRDGITARINARLGGPLVHKIVLSIERAPRPEADGTPGMREDGESNDE